MNVSRIPHVPADGHTRLVGLAKITLPLIGVGLLSGLFLLSAPAERAAPPSPQAQIAAREGRLTGPVHAGVSEFGDAVEVSAGMARPVDGDPRTIDAEMIRARLRTVAGEVIDMSAPGGRIDLRAGSARLIGGLDLVTSNGLEMETEALSLDLGAGRAVSDGAVQGQAPFTTLEGDRLVVEGGRARLMGNVHMIYEPADPEAR